MDILLDSGLLISSLFLNTMAGFMQSDRGITIWAICK